MTIEQIVRPFQSPRPLNTRRVIPSSTKIEPQTAGVTWGAAGTLPSARESDVDQPSLGMDFKVEKKKEHSVLKPLKTEQVRVSQSSNSENFVDFERITKYQLKADKPTTLLSPRDRPGTTGFAPVPGTQGIGGGAQGIGAGSQAIGGGQQGVIIDPKDVTIVWP